MAYVLVENQQIVHLGPIAWKQRFIQSELNDLEVTGYKVPPVEQGYIKINDNFEIYPIAEQIIPAYDPLFEQLVGPTYTYNEKNSGYAIQYYTKQDSSLETVKNNLKQKAASIRYTKENSGTTFVIEGLSLDISTSREERNVFTNLLTTIGNNTVSWKFNGQFFDLDATKVQSIVESIHNHVQTQFAWEKTLCDQIDAANDTDTLKTITIE